MASHEARREGSAVRAPQIERYTAEREQEKQQPVSCPLQWSEGSAWVGIDGGNGEREGPRTERRVQDSVVLEFAEHQLRGDRKRGAGIAEEQWIEER